MPKDRFSDQAHAYASYRPGYPEQLYQNILSHCENRNMAWDCATGNGQVAHILSRYFKEVKATDISQNQLDLAIRKSNIEYLISPAESTPFSAESFDLITVAQAIHWFELDKFYLEVDRILKPGATLAIWGYGLIEFDDKKMNEVVNWFYRDITGPYWDAQRDIVDQHYNNLPFPYPVLSSLGFPIDLQYGPEDLVNLFSTWSAVRNFKRETGIDPMPLLKQRLEKTKLEKGTFSAHCPGFIFISQKPQS